MILKIFQILSLLIMFFLTWMQVCLSGESVKIQSVIEKIKSVEKIPFEQITIDGEKFQYRLFQQPINLSFSEIKGLPIKHDISPLYSMASYLSLICDVDRSTKELIETGLQFWEDREAALKGIQKEFEEKKDLWKNLRNDFSHTICLAEFKKDNFFVFITFQEYPIPYHEEFNPTSSPDRPSTSFRHMDYYIKNHRFYKSLYNQKDYNDYAFKVFSIVKNGALTKKFIFDNPYFKPSDPMPKETWHKWETFLKDYKVEGEFVHFDGEFVTIMKRDGTKEKIKYKKLCIADQFYVDKEVEEQKKRYEKELKELPEQLAKEPFHEWITKIHDYKVTGEFVSYDGKFVTIKKSDGKTEQIEYSRLSVDDKNYVQEKLLLQKRKQKK